MHTRQLAAGVAIPEVVLDSATAISRRLGVWVPWSPSGQLEPLRPRADPVKIQRSLASRAETLLLLSTKTGASALVVLNAVDTRNFLTPLILLPIIVLVTWTFNSIVGFK